MDSTSTSTPNNNNNNSSNCCVPQPIADAESKVAKALISLSTNERERLFEEIHGVVTEDKFAVEDSGGGGGGDKNFVPNVLQQFQQRINYIDVEERATNIAYRTATKMSPTFVQDPVFRLMFLRCEEYNVNAACQRLMNYLEFKLVLFGPEKLTKEITINDLSADDIMSLDCGMVQILPEKDRSGRTIMCIFPAYPRPRYYKSPDNLLRAIFLIEMILSKDPEIQKRGLVRVFYNTNPCRPGLKRSKSSSSPSTTTTKTTTTDTTTNNDDDGDDSVLILRMQQHKASTPIRCASNHTCLFMRMGVAPVSFVPPSSSSSSSSLDVVRNISHYGDDVHCLKELQRFGIPVSCFPIDGTGTMDLQGHQSWVRKVKKMMMNSNSNNYNDHHHHNDHHNGKNNSTTNTTTATATTTTLVPVEVSTATTTAAATAGTTATTVMDSKEAFGDVTSNNIANSTATDSHDDDTKTLHDQHHDQQRCCYYLETGDVQLSDICLGRGKRFQNHPGNIKFRQYLQSRQDEYRNNNRQGKAVIAKDIATVLAKAGCRFVRLVTPTITTTTTTTTTGDGGGGGEELWEEVKEREIHKTIAQCFRTLRKKTLTDNNNDDDKKKKNKNNPLFFLQQQQQQRQQQQGQQQNTPF